jgi:hypothetical protein
MKLCKNLMKVGSGGFTLALILLSFCSRSDNLGAFESKKFSVAAVPPMIDDPKCHLAA